MNRPDGKKYIRVHHDVFDISNRIKRIDESYFILLNRISGLFEVHSSLQAGGSFCLELPFPSLDARTLTFVRKYRCSRAKEIFAEMEHDNEILRRREEKNAMDILDETREKLNDFFRND